MLPYTPYWNLIVVRGHIWICILQWNKDGESGLWMGERERGDLKEIRNGWKRLKYSQRNTNWKMNIYVGSEHICPIKFCVWTLIFNSDLLRMANYFMAYFQSWLQIFILIIQNLILFHWIILMPWWNTIERTGSAWKSTHIDMSVIWRMRTCLVISVLDQVWKRNVTIPDNIIITIQPQFLIQ